MYDFNYNFIKKNFEAELLLTDTDSLEDDVYEECFDFSNYPKDSKFFNLSEKKVIGKMKDELDGVIA